MLIKMKSNNFFIVKNISVKLFFNITQLLEKKKLAKSNLASIFDIHIFLTSCYIDIANEVQVISDYIMGKL